MSKYRARCSTRQQHRRTIQGVYDPNDRLPCHIPGCTGLMRQDKNRTQNPTGDRGATKLCLCDGFEMSTRGAPHRRGTRGCVHYAEVQLERAAKPTPLHSPIKHDSGDCSF